jgi:Flagellar assembly protein FliH
MEKPLFKHVGRSGASGQFEDVGSKLDVLPAWLDASTLKLRDPAVVSLRPPKIPADMPTERDEVESMPPPVPANDTWDMAPNEVPKTEAVKPAAAPPAAPASIPPPPKRPDTLFDELIPRADEEAVTAIREAVEGLVASRATMLRESEREVVELARIVAERVIARELSIDPRIVQGLVREGLGALSANDRVRVRLGSFFNEVRGDVETAIRRTGLEVTVEMDATLGAYGCIIETQWGAVDESIEQRLRIMLERLSVLPPAMNGKVKR